jgi:hypothetical protein
MASSPSRYLGSAILQGLGGGAQAYENLQKQQAEYGQPGQVSIPQQRVNIDAQAKALETAKYLTTAMQRKQDPTTGEIFWVGPNGRMTDAEHAALMGQAGSVLKGVNPIIGGAINGSTQPSSAGPTITGNVPPTKPITGTALPPPAAGNAAPANPQPTAPVSSPQATQPTPTGSAPPPVILDDSSVAIDKERPSWLIARNNQLQAAKQKAGSEGVDTGPIDKEISENQGTLQAIMKGEYTPLTKDNQPFTPYRDAANQRAAQSETIKNFASANLDAWKAARADAETAADMQSQTQLLLDTAFDPKTGKPTVSTGPISSQINYLTGIATQLGAPKSLIDQISSASNAQEIEKLTVQLGTMYGRQALGSGNRETQAEFMQFLKTVPGLGLSSDAIKKIANEAILPKVKQSLGTWDAVKGMNPATDNVQQAITDYKIKNPWYTPVSSRPTSEGETAPQSLPKPADREVNKVYKTPKGEFIWTGAGWRKP